MTVPVADPAWTVPETHRILRQALAASLRPRIVHSQAFSAPLGTEACSSARRMRLLELRS